MPVKDMQRTVMAVTVLQEIKSTRYGEGVKGIFLGRKAKHNLLFTEYYSDGENKGFAKLSCWEGPES